MATSNNIMKNEMEDIETKLSDFEEVPYDDEIKEILIM